MNKQYYIFMKYFLRKNAFCDVLVICIVSVFITLIAYHFLTFLVFF